jgi:hypothetical protein
MLMNSINISFNYDKLKNIHYLTNTKTDYKKYVSNIKRVLKDDDINSNYDFIIENYETGDFIVGSFCEMCCKLCDFFGGEYSYRVNEVLYKKKFSNDTITRWIECYYILYEKVCIEKPNINIYNYNKIKEQIESFDKYCDYMEITKKIVLHNIYEKRKLENNYRMKKIVRHLYPYENKNDYIENKYDICKLVK